MSLKARIQLLKLFPNGSSRVYSLEKDMEQIYCTQLGNEEGSRHWHCRPNGLRAVPRLVQLRDSMTRGHRQDLA